MRKEAVVAIFTGLVIAAIGVIGFLRADSSLKQNSKNISTPSSFDITQTAPIDSVDKYNNSSISLISPEDFDVISQNPLIVTGITKPNSTIIISLENKDYIFNALQDGSFSQEITLAGGLNQIVIKAYQETTLLTEKSLNLVYSSEFIKN